VDPAAQAAGAQQQEAFRVMSFPEGAQAAIEAGTMALVATSAAITGITIQDFQVITRPR
jgi:hypothetical protein